MKKIFTIAIAFLMAGQMMASENGVLSGNCGTNLTWTLSTDNGQLAISGTGNMTEYKKYFLVPWTINRSAIKSVLLTDGMTSVSQNAFYGCTGLDGVILPGSLTKVGASAFYGCTALSAIFLPEGLTRVGSSAFYGCTSLERISIPASVTKLDKSAFYGCSSLKEIDCRLAAPLAIDSTVFYGVSKSCRLIVNPGTADLWKKNTFWKNFIIIERK